MDYIKIRKGKTLRKKQQGGVLDLEELRSQLNNVTSKPDATSVVKPKTVAQPFAKNYLTGKVVQATDKDNAIPGTPLVNSNQVMHQDKVEAPPNKSIREKLITGLNHIDDNGDNMVAGIATQPLKAGLRLLRPDKYFDGVQNDSQVGSALANLGMDATMVAPVVSETAGLVPTNWLSRLRMESSGVPDVGLANLVKGSKEADLLKQRATALGEGNDWINQWKDDPKIQRRIVANNKKIMEEVTKYGIPAEGQPQIDPKQYLHTSLATPEQAQTMNDVSWLSGNPQGMYFHKDSQMPGYNGKGLVKPNLTPIDTKYAAIHEGTHQLTDGDNGIGGNAWWLLKKPFQPYNEYENTLGMTDKEKDWYKYYTKPTEIHARINELRAHYNLTPESVITPEQIRGMQNDAMMGSSPVDKGFFEHMKDPVAMAKAFNKMFTPAAIAAAASYKATDK